jgi:hypothetical protein
VQQIDCDILRDSWCLDDVIFITIKDHLSQQFYLFFLAISFFARKEGSNLFLFNDE